MVDISKMDRQTQTRTKLLRRCIFLAALFLLSCLSLSAIDLFADVNSPHISYDDGRHRQRQLEASSGDGGGGRLLLSAMPQGGGSQQEDESIQESSSPQTNNDGEGKRRHVSSERDGDGGQFTLCSRRRTSPAPIEYLPPNLEQKFLLPSSASCPRTHGGSEFNPDTPTLVLEGYETYGRTGNHIITLFNAIQYTRDNQFQLCIMYNSWAMNVILQYFFADRNHDGTEQEWKDRIERTLCIKVIHDTEDVAGWRVVLKDAVDLFRYKSFSPPEEIVANKLSVLRTLFRHYNTGQGTNQFGDTSRNMCSGVNALLGNRIEGLEPPPPSEATNYTVIHLRYLEGNVKLLLSQSMRTGCDPAGALEMSPDYVKSILKEAGMMNNPVIVITDNQQRKSLGMLLDDPEIGPQIQVVPESARWFGGDAMLAILANVFIGNPASTMTTFIASSRVALGFGEGNYLYRALDEDGHWFTVCGNECLLGNPKNISAPTNTNHGWKAYNIIVQQYVPPPSLQSRISMKQLRKEHEAVDTTKQLRSLALGTKKVVLPKRYTGLHPDEVKK